MVEADRFFIRGTQRRRMQRSRKAPQTVGERRGAFHVEGK